jgi:hypothetical protein
LLLLDSRHRREDGRPDQPDDAAFTRAGVPFADWARRLGTRWRLRDEPPSFELLHGDGRRETIAFLAVLNPAPPLDEALRAAGLDDAAVAEVIAMVEWKRARRRGGSPAPVE